MSFRYNCAPYYPQELLYNTEDNYTHNDYIVDDPYVTLSQSHKKKYNEHYQLDNTKQHIKKSKNKLPHKKDDLSTTHDDNIVTSNYDSQSINSEDMKQIANEFLSTTQNDLKKPTNHNQESIIKDVNDINQSLSKIDKRSLFDANKIKKLLIGLFLGIIILLLVDLICRINNKLMTLKRI